MTAGTKHIKKVFNSLKLTSGLTMVKANNKKYLIIAAVLFTLDQITKFLVLKLGRTIDFGILKIDEVHNTGASFGMLQGSNLILASISAIALFVIIFYFKRIDLQNKMATSIVSAGIMGNLADRITQGHVIDFIDFRWWPVFNIADMCIVLGVIWLMINTIRDDKNTNKKTLTKVKNKSKPKKKL